MKNLRFEPASSSAADPGARVLSDGQVKAAESEAKATQPA
jgi:hypothetical protein